MRWALLLIVAVSLAACGGEGSQVSGWPDVNLGATEVVEYKSTAERPLHLHIFAPDVDEARGAVLFFHGGGYRQTRVEQFRHCLLYTSDADDD